MKEFKKEDMSKIINDPDLRFYFMNSHRHGITIAIKENMKKFHQKNKGEKHD